VAFFVHERQEDVEGGGRERQEVADVRFDRHAVTIATVAIARKAIVTSYGDQRDGPT